VGAARPARLRFAYNTNGLAHHRLEDALGLLADEGYDGVALTLDPCHLDPLRAGPAEVARVARLLRRHRLACVVETGGRFVLDPARKHRPTLISRSGAGRRRDLLRRSLRIAADLGAPVVSFWSGARDPGTSRAEGMRRLAAAVEGLCRDAARAGVRLGFEPEPGHLVDTVAGWRALRDAVGHPALGLTLDLGHCLCEPGGDPVRAIRESAADLVAVQVEDMRRGVHEHLPFGEGDLDLRGCLRALREARFPGLVGVELSRDSHRAPEMVRASREALRRASL
jgi:L-ribulose-5-phosphate 3-epimerase